MSGDVKVHTEKEYGPLPRSSIGEPRKKLYKFPHLLFPYRSRYKSPNRQRWWPGSIPRFPVHTHPKRWVPLQELSVAYFAFHAKKSTSERNLYELMHTLPLRGAGSFFWRDGSQDAWKLEGRKANRVKARGVRVPEAGGQGRAIAAGKEAPGDAVPGDTAGGSGDGRNGAVEGVCLTGRETGATEAVHTRKQFVFSPREIFFKYRPFKALVFGHLTVGLVCVDRHAGSTSSDGFSDGESNRSTDEGSSSSRCRRILNGRSGVVSAANGGGCRAAAVIKGRTRVAPPQASLGGWKWQPPAGASRWIFRPAFPPPLSATFCASAS